MTTTIPAMIRASIGAHPAIDDPWEHMVYWAHVRAAEAGAQAATQMDLAAMMDCSEGGTVSGIEQRLEAKGWISVQRFQRGRAVTVIATGKTTAAPKCTTAHWRHRPEHQTDPFALLRLRSPSRADAVLKTARRERRSPAAVMVELISEALDAREQAA